MFNTLTTPLQHGRRDICHHRKASAACRELPCVGVVRERDGVDSLIDGATQNRLMAASMLHKVAWNITRQLTRESICRLGRSDRNIWFARTRWIHLKHWCEWRWTTACASYQVQKWSKEKKKKKKSHTWATSCRLRPRPKIRGYFSLQTWLFLCGLAFPWHANKFSGH